MFIKFTEEYMYQFYEYFGRDSSNIVNVFIKIKYCDTNFYLVKPTRTKAWTVNMEGCNGAVLIFKAPNAPNEKGDRYSGYEWVSESICLEVAITNRDNMHLLKR
jgi:hypothetical protein